MMVQHVQNMGDLKNVEPAYRWMHLVIVVNKGGGCLQTSGVPLINICSL